MPADNKRKRFWNDIKFKYKLTVTNENTLEDVTELYISKLYVILISVLVISVLFVVIAAIITFTPLHNYLPGYMNSELRTQIVNNALKADSIQQLLNKHNLYIMSIQDIFSGKVQTDTVQSIDSLTNMREEVLMERTKHEEDFRRQYEDNEKYNLTTIAARSEAEGLLFYRPAEGMIINHFDQANKHLGTDIATKAGTGVLAVLDGTVILSAYTPEDGYVLIVQHNQDFISVYKHCSLLLKKEGDSVKGSEAIASVGENSSNGEDSAHLHFELWHRGRAVDPELYIVF